MEKVQASAQDYRTRCWRETVEVEVGELAEEEEEEKETEGKEEEKAGISRKTSNYEMEHACAQSRLLAFSAAGLRDSPICLPFHQKYAPDVNQQQQPSSIDGFVTPTVVSARLIYLRRGMTEATKCSTDTRNIVDMYTSATAANMSDDENGLTGDGDEWSLFELISCGGGDGGGGGIVFPSPS
ncbi:hypothetical protein EGR_09396 [Echinococcus granulosus]|uniref:Uncharacterized protein n=1 Tax=Echinococcus granulosus TaxID=6210 RepID=W6U3Q9_ECHGR|nr:hypothetical protein EGR_09396 [Echinococcus granulosus]EUB55738.1 hypothetical protein EGR_09396 [Echinococcus granulosus]